MTSFIAFRTHVWNAWVQRSFEALCKARDGRVVAVFDTTHADPEMVDLVRNNHRGATDGAEGAEVVEVTSPDQPPPSGLPCVLLVSDQVCAIQNPLLLGPGAGPNTGSRFRGESHVVLVYRMFASSLDFEYLWLLEYDIYAHGDINVPLAACDAIEADFMAKGADDAFAIRRGSTDPGWAWWGDLYGPDVADLPLECRIGCFYPASRYSRAFLSVLARNLGRNSGFCEVYIPTLCVMHGLKYAAMPEEAFGEFRYFGPMAPDDARFTSTPPDDKLYHPVRA